MRTLLPEAILERTLREKIQKVAEKLRPEVINMFYGVGEDSTGEPSIFFRVVLTDAAATEANLAEITGQIATTIFDEVRPIEDWGLIPYFRFRSESEMLHNPNPEWTA
jgi:hypothetical protein